MVNDDCKEEERIHVRMVVTGLFLDGMFVLITVPAVIFSLRHFGILSWELCYFLAILGGVVWLLVKSFFDLPGWRATLVRPAKRGFCVECGYDLGGNADSHECPECGAAVSNEVGGSSG